MGFHVDEAKVAWESLSILKTGHDDHGNLLNLYYNSFGDYRPTGIFYSAIPFLLLLGRTAFAVRFSSAFLGALTIFPVFYISFLITKNKKISLFSAFLISIVPWHIATSRATSEVVISCFLILSSLALVVKKPILSFLLLVLSFFFYHSARVEGPILMFTLIIYSWNKIKDIQLKRRLFFGFLITIFVVLLLFLSPEGRGRYNQVKLPSPSIRNIFTNYITYFNPNFFIDDIARPFRYTTENVGIISIPVFILFLLGIYVIVRTNKNKILLLFFALGPIPAALTLEDSPNLHRAFFVLPFFIIISAIGINYLFEKHKLAFRLIFFCIVWSFVSFTINYLNTATNLAFQYRDPQTRRLMTYVSQIKNEYNKIYITNDPDSPYPWYGFFQNIDPGKMNLDLQKHVDGKWQFENIIWGNTKCPAGNAFFETKNDKDLPKVLVVDNGECYTDFGKQHPEAKIINEFQYNGKVNYRVWEYQPTI